MRWFFGGSDPLRESARSSFLEQQVLTNLDVLEIRDGLIRTAIISPSVYRVEC
jgi:hypothetical protein